MANQDSSIKPRQRIVHCKRRTGCITCKALHRKCDEAKPVCQRCLRTGRQCGGYSDSSVSSVKQPGFKGFRFVSVPKTTLSKITPSTSTQALTPLQKTALAFFKERTVASLTSPSPQQWVTDVLAAHNSYPVLQHCCIALGAVHLDLLDSRTVGQSQYKTNDRLPSNNAHERDVHTVSLREYTVALRLLQDHIKGSLSPEIVQLACVLLALYASVADRRHEFEIHLHHGLNLSNVVVNRVHRTSGGNALRSICSFYVLYGRPRKTYPTPLININDSLRALDICSAELLGTSQDIGAMFIDVRTVFIAVASFMVQLDTKRFPDLSTQQSVANRINDAIKLRQIHLDKLSTSPLLSVGDKISTRLLKGGYLLSYIYLKTWPSGYQCTFDQFEYEYQFILEAAEAIVQHLDREHDTPPAFSVDLGLIPALFFSAITLRHPGNRRRAIELLTHVPRKEGLWDADLCAYVASLTVTHEEGRARCAGFSVSTDSMTNFGIPEHCRINTVDVDEDEDTTSDRRFKKTVIFTWTCIGESSALKQTRVSI